MFDRIALKQTAREQIRDKIGILFICLLIYVAIMAIPSIIPGLGTFISFVAEPVISFGMVLIFLDIANGLRVEIPTLFKGFGENFGKIWLTYFLSQLFTVLWSFLFIVPGIVKGISYSMAPYILAENPHLTAREALEQSKQLTNGYKMDLFILYLSFIGWGLLASITFGIAYVYVYPYMQATFANAYYLLKGNQDAYYQNNM